MLLEQIWALPPTVELHNVKLIITQEDGRTAYAEGFGSRNYGGAQSLDATVYAMFSDRINTGTLSATIPGAGYNQGQVMSNLDLDAIALSIASTNVGGVYRTNVRLLRWGASFNLDLRLSPQTRTYQATGPTIGNAPRSALYVVSFQ